MNEDSSDTDLERLPIRASGTFGEFEWEFRGDIHNSEARTWVAYRNELGAGGGGGGVGALPLQDIGWTTTGHIGTMGWSRGSSGRRRRPAVPSFLSGVISNAVASVMIHLSDGTTGNASLLDSGNPWIKFFLLPCDGGVEWREVVALNAAGEPLDRKVADLWPV